MFIDNACSSPKAKSHHISIYIYNINLNKPTQTTRIYLLSEHSYHLHTNKFNNLQTLNQTSHELVD